MSNKTKEFLQNNWQRILEKELLERFGVQFNCFYDPSTDKTVIQPERIGHTVSKEQNAFIDGFISAINLAMAS